MIRILHVVHGMDCGGTENFIMNIYRNIDRSKIQFDFLVHTNKRCYFDDEIEKNGGHIYRVPYYVIFNIHSYKKAIKAILSSNKKWSAVHGHLGSCACIYLNIARKNGIYAIAHSHAINNKRITIRELLYRFHAFLARGKADYYMGCSYEAGVDRYGKSIADSNIFKIVNNGIKADDYAYNPAIRSAVRKEFGIENTKVVGHVGRFNVVKNHTFMVDILVELKKIDSTYAMMFVGDGELKEDIETQARNSGVLESIIFTGIRKDVPRMLQAMDYFIFPSFNEGLGIGLIEAQAAGLYCLANKDGIIPLAKISDLVEFLPVDYGAPKWAEQIDRTIKNNPERLIMSRLIKDAGFDVIEVSKWLENFYTQIKD